MKIVWDQKIYDYEVFIWTIFTSGNYYKHTCTQLKTIQRNFYHDTYWLLEKRLVELF